MTTARRGRPCKNLRKSSKCAPKVGRAKCLSNELGPTCQWIYGKKREFCRTRRNKSRK